MNSDSASLASLPEPLAPSQRVDSVEEVWRAESFQRLLEFSQNQNMRAVMLVNPERLRTLLRAGTIRDHALRGAMSSMNLNFDRVLIVIGAFLTGSAYVLPDSELLREEVSALRELGVVQGARSGQPGGWSGLTEQGRQFAVYIIHRIFVAAAETGENR